MIEHLRGERGVVDRLYDGAATVSETASRDGRPGSVKIRIGGDVAQGTTFRQALRATQDRDVTVRRLDEAERQRDLRLQHRDVVMPLPEAPRDAAGVGSLE